MILLSARLWQDKNPVEDILPSISAPTLVIHAISDAVQPIHQGRILASEIPNAKYVCLESRNHVPLPQEESWKRMVHDVEMFLEAIFA